MTRHEGRSRTGRGPRAGALLAAAALVMGMTAVAAPPGTAAAAPTFTRAQPFRPADTGARITAETRLGPQEVDITIESPSLGRSVKTRILLPRDWRADATATWPVLYAYHGGQDDYTSWPRNTDIEGWAAGYDAIVVMPEAADGAYADWYNYGFRGTPKWETFHTKEVVQLVERNYHAGTARAAIGDSAGGQGAITYAAKYPGMFRHVASLSGVLWLRAPGMPSLIMATNALNGQDPIAIYGFLVLNAANWRAHDPYELAPRLAGTKVFFSSGTTGNPGPGDPDAPPWDVGLFGEQAVGATNLAFRDRLDRLGVPYTADLYGDGRHNWPAWTRVASRVWPDLMASIGAREL
ncbi:alpha/beta hydrolase [Actinomadura rugatobispora]|uniref:Alpha/beta hydrolase n=1 Tax=Actinomadura rugatobispora TaxID=1994 RepID=A0ABW1ABP0_9ACTN|nr:alpha/beta hydrolase family protein [Actinomadura rugatobispora]